MTLLTNASFRELLLHVHQKREYTPKQLQELLQSQLNSNDSDGVNIIVTRLKLMKELKSQIQGLFDKLCEVLTGAQSVNCLQDCLKAVHVVLVRADESSEQTHARCLFSKAAKHITPIQFVLKVTIEGQDDEVQLSKVYDVSASWVIVLKAVIGLNTRDQWLMQYLDRSVEERIHAMNCINDAAKYLKLMTQTLKKQ